jgi:hypothetical protein
VIFWLLALPLFVAIVVFAVVNPGMVELSVWPLLEPPIAFPLYGVGLVGLLLGFVLGAAAAWMGGSRLRQRLRATIRQAESDQQQIAALKEQLDRVKGEGKPAPAALPPGNAA